jgi:ABC-2 type transport system ATP-binding protein
VSLSSIIIAEGTPAEIKTRTRGQKIRCITRVSVEEIRHIPGVLTVTADREAVEIRAATAEIVLRELFSRDTTLRGLEITNAGLEEAFLALTAENETK